ncbi:cupin domain-containing protein [Polaromonas sp. C04]|uniref:cupin domain-containing protein n=1 Tax=Polaromonas sp. C04 TaxID=1945857 RepID=UPI0009844857|nr:cupin domain-containing protein [Polaromonas sp. C04]OOG51828.1 cupin [Polaromonas sp. C04]
MALPHAQPLDAIDIRPLGAGLRTAKTHSLIKTEKLQLMQVVLAAGQGLPEHRAPSEVTVQCLEGEVEVATPNRLCRLQAGEVVVLPADEPHAVLAHRDATLLVTVLLHA